MDQIRTTPWTLNSTLALELEFEGGGVGGKNWKRLLDHWLLDFEPESLISMAEGCWETIWMIVFFCFCFFDSGFSSPSLCRDVVSWSGWPSDASTVRWPRPTLEKQPGAGQARSVCQTVTLRCGSCCRGRRTGSVVAWSSLHQRWGLGRGTTAWATVGAGSNRSSYCSFSRFSFQTQGLPAGPYLLLFLLSSEEKAGPVWIRGWGH